MLGDLNGGYTGRCLGDATKRKQGGVKQSHQDYESQMHVQRVIWRAYAQIPGHRNPGTHEGGRIELAIRNKSSMPNKYTRGCAALPITDRRAWKEEGIALVLQDESAPRHEHNSA